MNKLLLLSLFVLGGINFAPVLGVLDAALIESGYQVSLNSDNLTILMQHRALLFGILGGFVWVSMFKPSYQVPALIMCGISMWGFVLLAHWQGGYDQGIAKVLLVDYVALVFWGLAIVLRRRISAA